MTTKWCEQYLYNNFKKEIRPYLRFLPRHHATWIHYLTLKEMNRC